jgi:hypothetical protein
VRFDDLEARHELSVHACQAFVDEVSHAHAGRLLVPGIELIHSILKISDRLGQPLNVQSRRALLTVHRIEFEHWSGSGLFRNLYDAAAGRTR